MTKKKKHLSVGQSKFKKRFRRRRYHAIQQQRSQTFGARKLNLNNPNPPKICKVIHTQTEDPSSSDPDPSSTSAYSNSDPSSDDDFDDLGYLEQKAYEQLRNHNNVIRLVKVLSAKHLLKEFLSLFELLCTRQLPPDNIAILLALERAKWQQLPTSTTMKYNPISKTFWSVVYRLCKGEGLRFFSGSKNHGQVVSKQTTRGKYSPAKSSINFAVPDERHLRHWNKKFGKIIKPGIIQETVDMVQNKGGLILMTDIKRLSPGLRGYSDGDVNLWGHEPPPTLQDRQQRMEAQMRHLHTLSDHIDSCNNEGDLDVSYYRSTIHQISLSILDIKDRYVQERKKMKYFSTKRTQSGIATLYNKKISLCRTNLYCCSNIVKKGLNLISDLCKQVHILKDFFNHSLLPGQILDSDLHQWKHLRPIAELEQVYDLLEHTDILPQRSELWHELRSQVPVTASTLYNSLGLAGRKAMMTHIAEKYQGQQEPIPDAVKERMEHGTAHEVRLFSNSSQA